MVAENSTILERRNQLYADRLADFSKNIAAPQLPVEGHLTQMVGLALEAVGCRAPVGSRCRITSDYSDPIDAEVVGFAHGKLFLMPIDRIQGLDPSARVIPTQQTAEVLVGEKLLGRIIDGSGQPIDAQGELGCHEYTPLNGTAINPLQRKPITEPLDVGVRAINSLLSVGRGQRIGLFAGSGVGKSTLLGLMTRYTDADVVVVGLIGERGREVREFIEQTLGSEGMKRAVVVATPADDPPLMRLHGALRATAIAEHFRSQGLNVLLLMDSLTRYAQAQREIALAIGEPPVTKGYPPSVFAKIPQLVERAGNGSDNEGGSITAFYTILVEGDDHNDPIADAARAILDGHIVLSRQLAESGVYPAIDIEASISRSMAHVVDENHLSMAQHFRKIYSCYEQNRDLISVGAYREGSDTNVDQAIRQFPLLQQFIQQGSTEQADFNDSLRNLFNLSSQWG